MDYNQNIMNIYKQHPFISIVVVFIILVTLYNFFKWFTSCDLPNENYANSSNIKNMNIIDKKIKLYNPRSLYDAGISNPPSDGYTGKVTQYFNIKPNDDLYNYLDQNVNNSSIPKDDYSAYGSYGSYTGQIIDYNIPDEDTDVAGFNENIKFNQLSSVNGQTETEDINFKNFIDPVGSSSGVHPLFEDMPTKFNVITAESSLECNKTTTMPMPPMTQASILSASGTMFEANGSLKLNSQIKNNRH